MSRRIRLSILLVASLTVLALASTATGSPVAQAAKSCGVGTEHGFGYTYLTSLNVSRTSCKTGRRVAKHHGHVRGWRCHTKRLDASPVQYDSRVTCKSGRRQVKWTFTQDK
jgi:hypothetical protein